QVDTSVVQRDAAVHDVAARARAHLAGHVRIEAPELPPGARVEREHHAPRSRRIEHAVGDDRRGLESAVGAGRIAPGEPELRDVVLVDLVERAVALLARRAAVQRPVFFARLRLAARRPAKPASLRVGDTMPARRAGSAMLAPAREREQDTDDDERSLQLAAATGPPFTPGALSTIMPPRRHCACVRSVIRPRLRRFGITVCMNGMLLTVAHCSMPRNARVNCSGSMSYFGPSSCSMSSC